jgi:hypothetical protein
MPAKKQKIDKCRPCKGTGFISVGGLSENKRQQLPRCPKCGGTGTATAKSHIMDGWKQNDPASSLGPERDGAGVKARNEGLSAFPLCDTAPR